MMDVLSNAKSKSKALLIKYGISKLTLENMIYVIENQGFEILEYSQYQCDDSVWAIIERLNLVAYAQAGKAFAYQHGKAKLLFICDEMTADEKLYALAHEEGHILCGHLSNGVCDGSLIEQEHLANEVAHYLLNPPLHIKALIKLLERKKYVIAIISVIGILAVALIVVTTIQQNANYYGNYYVTENGTKYHEEDCMIICRFIHFCTTCVEVKKDLSPIRVQVPLNIFDYSSMTSNIILAPSLKLFWNIRQSVMV